MENKIVSFNPQQNGKNYDGEKMRIGSWHVIVRDDSADWCRERQGGMRELIDVRLWASKSGDDASPVYASVWIHGGKEPNTHAAGNGRASGYGYHKASAAVEEALRSAGVRFEKEIGGVGDSAVEAALRALTAHLGFAECCVISS